jgi:hypothetical protein
MANLRVVRPMRGVAWPSARYSGPCGFGRDFGPGQGSATNGCVVNDRESESAAIAPDFRIVGEFVLACPTDAQTSP